MGHIKASLCWQTKESGKPKKKKQNETSKWGRKGAQKKRRRKKNSGTQTWTGRQTLSAFLLSNAVKRLQSCKGSRPAPPRMSCQAAGQPGWEPASQPYQEQEADVALATVSVSLFRVSLRLACSHSHSNWRRQDTDPDPDPHWDIPYDVLRRDPVSYFDSDSGMFQFVMLAIYHVCNCLSPDLIRSNESRVTSARGVWAMVSGLFLEQVGGNVQ